MVQLELHEIPILRTNICIHCHFSNMESIGKIWLCLWHYFSIFATKTNKPLQLDSFTSTITPDVQITLMFKVNNELIFIFFTNIWSKLQHWICMIVLLVEIKLLIEVLNAYFYLFFGFHDNVLHKHFVVFFERCILSLFFQTWVLKHQLDIWQPAGKDMHSGILSSTLCWMGPTSWMMKYDTSTLAWICISFVYCLLTRWWFNFTILKFPLN